MERKLLIKEAVRILEGAGYKVVEIRNVHTCFDILAEKNREKILAKVVSNIDSVQEHEARELSKLASFLEAKPVIIGNTSKNGRLALNLIYERFSVRCVSPFTFESLIFNANVLFASKGSSAKVAIDKEKLNRLISLSNTSIRKIAKSVNISKDTLYRYSKEGGFASFSTAEKLRKYFNVGVEANIEWKEEKISTLKGIAFGKMELAAISINSAPFSIIAKGKNYYEISTDADLRTLAKQSQVLKAISETFEGNYPFFAIDTKSPLFHGVPVITKKKLLSVPSEDELIEELVTKY